MPCGKCGAPQIRSAGRLFAAALASPSRWKGCNALADTGSMSVRFEPVIVNGLLVKSSISLKSLEVAVPIDLASATRAARRGPFFDGSPCAPVASSHESRGT
jgi:hypothetical protein